MKLIKYPVRYDEETATVRQNKKEFNVVLTVSNNLWAFAKDSAPYNVHKEHTDQIGNFIAESINKNHPAHMCGDRWYDEGKP